MYHTHEYIRLHFRAIPCYNREAWQNGWGVPSYNLLQRQVIVIAARYEKNRKKYFSENY